MKNKQWINKKIPVLLFVAALFLPVILAGHVVAAERVTVKSRIANLRSGPGIANDVLWQVEENHPFLVTDEKGKWVKIKDFEGDMAWIHQSLLGQFKGVITTKFKSNVRSKPDIKGKILFTVEQGVPFKEIERRGNWVRIEHADGDTGWIHKNLVW